ncbi:unnamed protein product [Darwinula stevensoni]|uniref:Transcription initiation factor TFIID subunit 13 n=1 Tax=Darwinula stevensoni TaxID=69355 RepID=A0A7R9A0L9_9CRUS|nr:unnamed protein product [Darwinula stevensoni]CAG0885834.1 unnamed protein product [Darwinula stevensoni]
MGTMKEFDWEGERVLVVQQNGVFYAIGGKCTHYGGPLGKGVYSNGKIRCPWHGACFNVTTGDIEDFPGLDHLPCLKAHVQHGKVIIEGQPEQLSVGKRTFPPGPGVYVEGEHQTFIIIGAGAAGLTCAQTLRNQLGFTGRLILLSKEHHLPYDRPKISKSLGIEEAQAILRDRKFFKDCGIEWLPEKEVKSINTTSRTIIFQSGSPLPFTKCLIASGARARKMDGTPGFDLPGIFSLRSLDDGKEVSQQVLDKKVVVVGASFIGMEVAAAITGKAAKVTVVVSGKVPFERILGQQIGARIMRIFEAKGVEFVLGVDVKEFQSFEDTGSLGSVVLNNGHALEAQVAILGVGVEPETGFLSQPGLNLNERGYLIVNKWMETNVDGIFGAGDVVSFPLWLHHKGNVSIGHWQLAQAMGRCAAFNMMGSRQELRTVPFFWSVLFDEKLRYAGYAGDFDDIVIKGNLEDLKFRAYYAQGERILAIATMNSDPLAAKFAAALEEGPEEEQEGESQPIQADKRKRLFSKELRCMLYGFGDDQNPYTETVDFLEDLVIQYITEMTHKAMEVGKSGRVQVEDIIYMVRKDARKYARVRDLLNMNEELKKARKAFDEVKYASV